MIKCHVRTVCFAAAIKKNHIRSGLAGAWTKTFSDAEETAFDAHHAAECERLDLPAAAFPWRDLL